MATLVYDIAIIGAGASGLQLLYELTQANPEQKILLLDSGDRSAKSWCFWENKDASCFPFLIEKSWDSMLYKTSKGESITSDINPQAYHYISSTKFFTYFFEEFIPANTNITCINTGCPAPREPPELPRQQKRTKSHWSDFSPNLTPPTPLASIVLS